MTALEWHRVEDANGRRDVAELVECTYIVEREGRGWILASTVQGGPRGQFKTMTAAREAAQLHADRYGDQVESPPAPARPNPMEWKKAPPPVETHLAYVANYTATIATAQTGQRFHVEAAREAGATWTEIGQALGVTKQSAREKYGRKQTGNPDNHPTLL